MTAILMVAAILASFAAFILTMGAVESSESDRIIPAAGCAIGAGLVWVAAAIAYAADTLAARRTETIPPEERLEPQRDEPAEDRQF